MQAPNKVNQDNACRSRKSLKAMAKAKAKANEMTTAIASKPTRSSLQVKNKRFLTFSYSA